MRGLRHRTAVSSLIGCTVVKIRELFSLIFKLELILQLIEEPFSLI